MRLLAAGSRTSGTKASPRAFSRAASSVLRSRAPTLHHFSTGSQPTARTPQAFPYSRSLVIAGCALVGIWSATGFVYMTSSPVRLDNDAPERASQGQTSHSSSVGGSVAYAPFIDQELRRYEKTCIPPLDSNISRYDVVRLAR